MGLLAGPHLQAEGFRALHDRTRRGLDIGIYANPNYYFQYDSQEFRDAYAKALKAPNEEEKAKWFGRCQEIIAEDAVNGYLFLAPSLSAMKAELMDWWKDYPTIALDCTEVWWNK